MVLALTVVFVSTASAGYGTVTVDATPIAVRIVTVKGSPINDRLPRFGGRRGSQTFALEGLVLFSLSPESLLAAADRSRNGRAVAVERPLPLILYGTPDDQ